MYIWVNQSHISRGRRMAGDGCPVSLALQEHFSLVTVGYSTFVIWHLLRKVSLPEEVTLRILEYDRGGDMQPFSFEIDYDHPGDSGKHPLRSAGTIPVVPDRPSSERGVQNRVRNRSSINRLGRRQRVVRPQPVHN